MNLSLVSLILFTLIIMGCGKESNRPLLPYNNIVLTSNQSESGNDFIPKTKLIVKSEVFKSINGLNVKVLFSPAGKIRHISAKAGFGTMAQLQRTYRDRVVSIYGKRYTMEVSFKLGQNFIADPLGQAYLHMKENATNNYVYNSYQALQDLPIDKSFFSSTDYELELIDQLEFTFLSQFFESKMSLILLPSKRGATNRGGTHLTQDGDSN